MKVKLTPAVVPLSKHVIIFQELQAKTMQPILK